MPIKSTSVSRLKSWLPVPIAAGGIVLFLNFRAFQPYTYYSYELHNYSGKRLFAATIGDQSGARAASRDDIAEGDADTLRSSLPGRQGKQLTIQWLAGNGRAQWYQATVPLLAVQAQASELHVFLRPDSVACVSLNDDDAVSIAAKKSPTSCAKVAHMPPLAPGMALALHPGTIVHSDVNFESSNSPPVSHQTLKHSAGQVALFDVDEFPFANMMGKQAAWLVTFPVPASSDWGTFIVTADAAGWQSRFLGPLEPRSERLPGSRGMLRSTRGLAIIADTATAEMFILPDAQTAIIG